MIPHDDGCIYGCASLIGRVWRALGLGVLVVLLLLAALPAGGQGESLAECTWRHIGPYQNAVAWRPGRRAYLPMSEVAVNYWLSQTDMTRQALPYYGDSAGWEDDAWLLDGEAVRTWPEDRTWSIVVNDAAVITIWQGRVIVVGFRDDGNPDAAWHCLCHAYAMQVVP